MDEFFGKYIGTRQIIISRPKTPKRLLDEISKVGYGIGVNYHHVNPDFITKVKQENLKIHVYNTVENKTEMSKQIEIK